MSLRAFNTDALERFCRKIFAMYHTNLTFKGTLAILSSVVMTVHPVSCPGSL